MARPTLGMTDHFAAEACVFERTLRGMFVVRRRRSLHPTMPGMGLVQLVNLADGVAYDDFDPYEQQCEVGAPCDTPEGQALIGIAGVLDVSLIILAIAGFVTWLVRRNK